MSVSNSNAIAQYTGNGATTTFALSTAGNPIPFFAAGDWAVNLFDTAANANVAPQPVLNGGGTYDYTIVTTATDANTGELTGNLVYNTALPSNYRSTAQRAVPATSSNNFLDNAKFPAVSVNAALDRQMMVAQQIAAVLAYCLQAPTSDPVGLSYALPPAATRALQYLGFDGAGNVAALAAPLTGTAVSPAMAPVVASSVMVLRSHLAGLALSNDVGTPNSKLDVAAGICCDDSQATLIASAGGVIDCATVGANGLDAGALATNTWYHAYAIAKAAGAAPALLASQSASAPVLPGGYTLKRRIGSFRTDGSAHILAFVQDGDSFAFKATVLDVNVANPTTGAVGYALSTPLGVRCQAIIEVGFVSTDITGFALITDLAVTDETPGPTHATIGSVAGANAEIVAGPFAVFTDTASRVRARCSASSASTNLVIRTRGWIDTRGRFA